MNELDSEIMVGILEQKGLQKTESEEEADLLLFNTCSIRDLAERKVMGKLGQIGRKEKRALIGITGCMAMAKKESLFQKLPQIDFVIGTNNIADLGAVLDELLLNGKQIIRTEKQFQDNIDYLVAKREDRVKAFVSIIRGCNKFCTYCVVPHTRGQEVSRPSASIEEECRKLVDQGYREITLLGQNVNSYGKDQPSWKERFHDLLYKLDKIKGLSRIRFMTSHPSDIDFKLIEAIRDLPSVAEFVHFPLQSGSNPILKKMHRLYTVEEYMEKVRLLKSMVPNVSLGTDIIVGFPTETDEDFELTYNYFKEIGYSAAFLFAYSPRKGTPAYRWEETLSEQVKKERLQSLLSLHEKMVAEENKKLLGTQLEVLVEGGNRDNIYLKGRSRSWKKVLFKGNDSLIGTLQKIRINGYSSQTLLGEIV